MEMPGEMFFVIKHKISLKMAMWENILHLQKIIEDKHCNQIVCVSQKRLISIFPLCHLMT